MPERARQGLVDLREIPPDHRAVEPLQDLGDRLALEQELKSRSDHDLWRVLATAPQVVVRPAERGLEAVLLGAVVDHDVEAPAVALLRLGRLSVATSGL